MVHKPGCTRIYPQAPLLALAAIPLATGYREAVFDALCGLAIAAESWVGDLDLAVSRDGHQPDVSNADNVGILHLYSRGIQISGESGQVSAGPALIVVDEVREAQRGRGQMDVVDEGPYLKHVRNRKHSIGSSVGAISNQQRC
jgi:hypothetical protein